VCATSQPAGLWHRLPPLVIDHEQTGMLVPFFDPSAVAREVLNLLDDVHASRGDKVLCREIPVSG
jgi:hypothetical protein